MEKIISCLHTFIGSGSTPREPVRCRATTAQAAGIAEQSKGGRMNLLFTNYGKNEVTPRAPPRVKMEAEGNYEMSRGWLTYINM